MKKVLFLILYLCSSLCIYSQRIDKPGEPYDYFCNVSIGEDNEGIVFMPDEENNNKNPLLLCDSLDNVINFNSLASIIIYMTKRGWEYVDTRFGNSFGRDIKVALLMKKVTNDADAYQYITLQRKNKIKKRKED